MGPQRERQDDGAQRSEHEEIRSLDQTARAQLRKYGVRFGAFNIYFPVLMKPAAADLTLSLWALKQAAAGLDPESLPEPPRPGLTSVPAQDEVPEAFYRACGYHRCGPRAVRMDILERALSYDEVTEIFVRVNSLGAKLRSSDLALAQITAKWRGALKTFQAFVAELTAAPHVRNVKTSLTLRNSKDAAMVPMELKRD